MAAVEVPHTLEYRGGQLNAVPVLEVENFTNWKKRKPEGQWTGDERKVVNLDQRLKSLIMFVLPDDQMNSVINCLTTKSTWDGMILYHEGPSDVKESMVMDLKLCYNTFKFKEALSTAFISTSIVQDFQDSPDDEEDKRSSHEYLNDLEEEYQARALLNKSKRFFKKGTQRFSSAKATDQTECHKCGKKELRPTKDFEAKYNKVKAKLALLSSSALASKATTIKNKCLIVEAYEWYEEEVSSDDNTMVEVKVLMALAEENDAIRKEGARNGVKVNEPSSAPAKGNKSSSASKVNSAPAGKLKSVKIEDDPPLAIVIKELNDLKLQIGKNQSSYSRNNQQCERTDHRTCNHAEYISTINMSQHLKSLGRSSSRSKIPRPSKCFFPPCIYCGCIDHLSNECLYHPICRLCGSYDHDTNGNDRIISLERDINPKNPQHAFKRCEACGSSTHTITDHYDIEWFKRGEALQAKKCDIRKPIWYLDSGCSRHITSVKSYLHRYVEQPGPKVVFGDNSTCTTEGYDSIKCNGIVFTKVAFVNGLKYNLISISQVCDAKYIIYFYKKRGTIFNSNKEVVMIAPKRSVFSKQYWTEAVATACYTQNKSTIVKRHLKTPYEIFRKRIPNINFLHVFGCSIYIHNHKDHLGKFDENADDGYLLGYSLVSNAFRVFNTRRQKTKETYHITFDESPDAIKFSKPLVVNINIVENERYLLDEYLHPYEPSQRYQTNGNNVPFIEPYECPEPVVLELKFHLTIMVKLIKMIRAGMLTRAMDKELSATSAHECLFVDSL
ncbi:retrovirus-related pol polyprotein from transposon TNT 1-94 [Tanacetum coccineum]|uniref:Retrovirus-related pol polyprotein from transposon TNT 1-94 n=1 Tax=Tanacetum coccineum TaxID=301880 RepID=A0ABQ4Y7Q0_9ASTR